MSKALVEIIGDATSYLRATKQSTTSTNTLVASVKELKVNTISAAQAQVAATVKKQAKLREEIASYKQLASSAKRGSAEQIAAANHAVQAQQRLSRSLGVSAHESRQLASSSKVVERDFGRTARGALSASVGIRGMGRSLAFASGYFLGGAGLVYGLKASVEAAESLEKAQRSLAVTIRKTGGNVAATLPGIERWAKAQVAVGVTAVQAEQGLARASAITGSAAKGQRAYTEALLISKATGKAFNSVLIAAAKANNGSTTALARYIGKIAKGTSAQKLYNDVIGRYKGQAEANTTATEKLRAVLSNIEATVGTALLPTINELAASLTKWLEKSKNQERIQHDVSSAVRTTVSVMRTFVAVTKEVTGAVGGLKNAVELLVALKLGSVLARWSIGIIGLGTASTTATAEVGGFRAALLGLNAVKFGPLAVALGGILYLFEQIREDSKITKTIGNVKGSTSRQVVERKGQFFEITHNAGRGPSNRVKRISAAEAQALTGKSVAPKPHPDRGFRDANLGGSGAQPPVTTTRKISLQGQVNLADLAIATAANTPGNKDDLAALRRKEALLRAQIAKGGTLAQQTQREQDLKSTKDAVASILSGANKKTVDTAKKRLAALTKADRELIKSFAIQLTNAKSAGSDAQLKVLTAERSALQRRLKVEKGNQVLQQALANTQQKIASILSAQKQKMQQALDSAKQVVGELGQGPVATGPAAQFLQQYGGHLTAPAFTQDVAAQNKQSIAFLTNLTKLAKRGAPSSLVQTLLGQGQGGMDEASALAHASKKNLAAFLAVYDKRQKVLQRVARMEVHTPVVHVQAKTVNVSPGRSDAHDRATGKKFGRTVNSGRRG